MLRRNLESMLAWQSLPKAENFFLRSDMDESGLPAFLR